MTFTRTVLLAGTALATLAAATAHAAPERAKAHHDGADGGYVGVADGAMQPHLIVRDDVDGATNPGEALDNSFDAADEWGSLVQIFLQDNASGGIFFNCTGSLINPRTVLTAAHCLNSSSSEAYGLPGEAPLTMLLGFGPDTQPAISNYAASGGLLGYSQGGVARSTDVVIHPSANLDNGALPFPWADVAMIALDEPVSDVPTLGMLFSPLDQLTHVIVGGYGTTGTGDTGGTGSGFRRIMGENELGLIGSPADLIDGVFPSFAPSRDTLGFETQTFYWMDFDDPTRTPADEAGCTFTGVDISCADLDAVKAIDWFEGDALPREAGTAPGDSGSPMIADQLADFPLILGVLSGGFDFFGTNNRYGDISFYNPLFPFYEFISANSPYKYVSAVEGDGLWTDPDHWTQDLDPNFYVIDENGEIVNGLPDGPEDGVYDSDDKVGSVLGDDISGNDPSDSPLLPPRSAGGAEVALNADPTGGRGEPNGVQIGAIDPAGLTDAGAGEPGRQGAQDGPANVSTGEVDREIIGAPTAATPQDAPGFGNNLPTSSVLQGPGSTGFVPNNTDGTPGTAFENPAQYFDVSFTNAGVTTLTGEGALLDIVVDQVSLLNGGATLDIIDGGGLFSLIGVNVMAGTLRVGELGYLETPLLINDMGIVTGSGFIVSDLFLNRGGLVDPDFTGQPNTLGELRILGDYVQQGQGVLRIDIFNDAGTATSNDLLNIIGSAALDGTLMTVVADPTAAPRGSTYTVLQASSGVTGAFANEMTQYSAVLSFDVAYGPGAVTLTAVAADYSDVLAGSSANVQAVAGALDGATAPDETPSAELAPLVTALDALPNASTLGAAFSTLAGTETLVFDQIGAVGGRSASAIFDSRTGAHARGAAAGGGGLTLRSSAEPVLMASAGQSATMPSERGGERVLPDGLNGFITGDVAFSEGSNQVVSDRIDTATVAAGLETRLNPSVLVGGAITGAWHEVDPGPYRFDAEGEGVGVFAGYSHEIVHISGHAGFMAHDLRSERPVFSPGGTETAVGETSAQQTYAGLEVGLGLSLPNGGEITPLVRVRHSKLDIDAYREVGAGGGSAEYEARTAERITASTGAAAWVPIGSRLSVSGELTVESIVDGDQPSAAQVALQAAPGAGFTVTGAPLDDQYYAARLGAGYRLIDGVMVQGRYERDIDRDDFDYERFMVSLSFGF